MPIRLFAPIVILFLLASCSGESGGSAFGLIPQPQKSTTMDSVALAKSYEIQRFEKFVAKPILSKVWIDTSVFMPFSQESRPDKFQVKIIGDEYYNAMIHLVVSQQGRQVIYQDSFPLLDALAIGFDGGGHYGTDLQKERFIKKYVEGMLNPENLSTAILDQTANLIEDYKIHPNFETLIADSAYKTFTYVKRKNSETMISFSPVSKQAMVYYEY